MFKFSREKILPLFLAMKISIAELAKKAGVQHKTAQRAVNGEKVGAQIVTKIAAALEIVDVVDYLERK